MPVDLQTLKTELTTDPNGYGYVTSPLTEPVGSLNAELLNQVRVGIAIDRGVIPAHEIVDAIVAAEWTNLSDVERTRITFIVGAGEVNVRATNTRSAFLAAFGPGTATRTNLAALQTRQGSRAEQLFGQFVTFRDVLNALGLP